MVAIHQIDNDILDILNTVTDPEIPVLTVLDLGIIKQVNRNGDQINIDITPTYTGCPAMDTIAADLIDAFNKSNMTAEVILVLHPAWTTDDITEEGRRKLEEYGIASPQDENTNARILLFGEKILSCPRCKSTNTELVSQFGSTACKALFKCNDCLEPFDYFKCHR